MPRKKGRDMKRFRWAWLLLVSLWPLLALACVARADESLARDAAEYRALRKVTDGDARKWRGRKHVLMVRLGEQLGDGRRSVEQVQSLMGMPDRMARPGDDLWRMIWHDEAAPKPSTVPVTRLLIYEWRGGHDFLYFICDGG